MSKICADTTLHCMLDMLGFKWQFNMDVSKNIKSSNRLLCRNSKVMWLLNYKGKHITLGQTLNEVTDGLPCFIHEQEALQTETKTKTGQRILDSRKTKRGRSRNEFFKVEIRIRNFAVQLLEQTWLKRFGHMTRIDRTEYGVMRCIYC